MQRIAYGQWYRFNNTEKNKKWRIPGLEKPVCPLF
jgi:hypothetical protein